MSVERNRRILLAHVPQGMRVEADFNRGETAMPACSDDGLPARTRWLSHETCLRGRISGRQSYVAPISIGSVMEGGCERSFRRSRRILPKMPR